jgi:hypothetical protein
MPEEHMPFLIVPPPEPYPEQPHVYISIRKEIDAYQKKVLEEAGISPQTAPVFDPRFPHVKIYPWDRSYSAIAIHNFYALDRKNKQLIDYKVSSFIEKTNCRLLGNYYELDQNSTLTSFAVSKKRSIKEILLEKSKEDLPATPVKVTLKSENIVIFPYEERVVTNVIEEEFVNKGFLVLANQWHAPYCQINLQGLGLEEKKDTLTFTPHYPSKPHTVIDLTFYRQEITAGPKAITDKEEVTEIKEDISAKGTPSSLSVRVESVLMSGMLSKLQVRFEKVYEKESFYKLTFLKDLMPYVKKQQKENNNKDFKVLKREGAYVYLEGGPLLGLEIGVRLVGPKASTLHVVKYDLQDTTLNDVSVAFIRYEDSSTPLKKDDVLQIDPTTYPKK